jgi:ABC-type transporter Mla subunit MlaD
LNTGFDWRIVLDAGVGVGVLLVGISMMIAMSALARTLGRVNVTLGEVDRQLEGLGQPVGQTLTHVSGIADTADQTVARLTGVVKSLEDVAGSAAQTAELTRSALSPAIVNVGAAIAGVSAGLRRLVNGRHD